MKDINLNHNKYHKILVVSDLFEDKKTITWVSNWNWKISPTSVIFFVKGCFSVVPPTITIELLTIAQANSM